MKLKYHCPFYWRRSLELNDFSNQDEIPDWVKSVSEYSWTGRAGSISSSEDLVRSIKEAEDVVRILSSMGYSVMLCFRNQVDEVTPTNTGKGEFYIQVIAKMYSGEGEEELRERVDKEMAESSMPPKFEFPK